MTNFELGAGIALGLGIITWIIWTESRISKLQSATLIAREKLKDDEIIMRVHAMPDDKLDDLLKSSVGSRDPKG